MMSMRDAQCDALFASSLRRSDAPTAEAIAEAIRWAVRRVSLPDAVIRQRLLAHSDLERSYSYLFCQPAPVLNYVATLRVTPMVEGGKAFVEWSATFDCPADEGKRWIDFFEKEGFAG